MTAVDVAVPEDDVNQADGVTLVHLLAELPDRTAIVFEKPSSLQTRTDYAGRRFASGIRRDSHSRYAPITASTTKQKMGYQAGTPMFVMS